MKQVVVVMIGVVALGGTAWADDEALDWRNEEPGFGFGLVMGPTGPSANLRGWSSAALSVDLGAAWMVRQDSADGVFGTSDSKAQSGQFRLAPRVRVWGSEATDVVLVPGVSVELLRTEQSGVSSTGTTVRASGGVAVDRWLAPGVCFSGRLDLVEAGIVSASGDSASGSASLFRAALTPSVALHVYPLRPKDRR